MKIMVKKVGEELKEVDQKLEYKDMRDLVGGFIEAVHLEHDVVCWINEEGKLIGLKPNFNVGNISIVGDAFFAGETKAGNNKALTAKQIEYIKSLFVEKPKSDYQILVDKVFGSYDMPVEVWTFEGEGKLFGEPATVIRQIDSLSALAYLRNIKDEDNQQMISTGITLMHMFDDKNALMGLLGSVAKQMFHDGE